MIENTWESKQTHENPHQNPGKYHQNRGFSMAMLVSERVIPYTIQTTFRLCSNEYHPGSESKSHGEVGNIRFKGAFGKGYY